MSLPIKPFLTDVSLEEMIVNGLPLFLTNVLGVRTAMVGAWNGLGASALFMFGALMTLLTALLLRLWVPHGKIDQAASI